MFSLRSMSLASVVLTTWLTDIVAVPTIAAAQSRLPQCPKIWLRGWTNCQGTFTFANGDKGDGRTPGHEANTRSLNRWECWAGSCEQAPNRKFHGIGRLVSISEIATKGR